MSSTTPARPRVSIQTEDFDLSAARVPRRFYETASASGMVTAERVQEMLGIYRKKRGWS